MSHGGKGSAPRPYSVSQDEYDRRWEAIFGRDVPKDEPMRCEKCGAPLVGEHVCEGSREQ